MKLPAWIKILIYRLGGSRPWTRGYIEAQALVINAALDDLGRTGKFIPAPGYGAGMDERSVEFPWFFQELPKGARRVLDAGSTLNHAMIMDRLPLNETHFFISTLAPEDVCFWKRGVSYTYEDFRDLSFRDA